MDKDAAREEEKWLIIDTEGSIFDDNAYIAGELFRYFPRSAAPPPPAPPPAPPPPPAQPPPADLRRAAVENFVRPEGGKIGDGETQ